MAFCLSPLTPSDFLPLSKCEYASFLNPLIRDLFMGPDTPSGHADHAARYANVAKRDPSDYWIKITDSATGDLVAASCWKIHPTLVQEHWEDLELKYLDDRPERQAECRRILESLLGMRRALYRGPHVQLFVFFTHPDYRRRGAGAMMMKWGCDLADQLFLPMWVEASVEGQALYSISGFKDYPYDLDGLQAKVMRREARTRTIGGGKALAAAQAAVGSEELKVIS